MGRFAFTITLAVCLLVPGWRAAPAAAAEPLTKVELASYLDLAWSSDSQQRAKADARYDELLPRGAGDERFGYAQVLVKIKQRQHAEALRLVETLTDVDKPKADYLRTRLWLCALLRQYGKAAIAAEKLVAAMPPVTDPPAEGEFEQEELARFLGRVQGFFDGPASESFAETQRTALRKKITEALGGERKVAFFEGRDAVLEQYLALTDEKESRRAKSKEEGERDRDAKLTDLDESRQQAAQRQKELDSRKERLRSELNDELKELQKQDSPLVRRFAQLDSQAASIRRQLAVIDSDRLQFEGLLARERDPVLRATYIRDLARLDALFARGEIDLNNVSRQAAAVTAQRADLDRRAAQARANAGQQVDSAEREQADLNRKVRRADAEERKLRNKNVGESTAGVLAKAAQAGAFTTYEPFPLDEQRQRLLDAFRAP